MDIEEHADTSRATATFAQVKFVEKRGDDQGVGWRSRGGPDASASVSVAVAIDVAALVTVGGCFVAAAGWLLQRQALVPLRDPRIAESLAFENV